MTASKPLRQNQAAKDRQEKDRILQINRREKREIIRSLSGWKQRFNLDFLESLSIRPISEEESLHSLIARIPVVEAFSPTLPSSGFFPCVFFSGHYAWTYVDEAGHHRYYTRKSGTRSKKETLSLDFGDMVELALDISPSLAVKEIVNRLPVGTFEGKWQDALTHYRRLNEDWSSSSLVNLKAIRSLMPVFFDLLLEGERQASSSHWRHKGSPVFFCSHRHLERRSGERSRSSITRSLNSLAALGMIRKLPIGDVPEGLMERAKLWTEKMGYTFHLSFFSIPSYEEAEPDVLKTHGEWKRSGASAGRISKDLVMEASGTEKADAVYPQADTGQDLTVLESILSETFRRSVKKGFVTKVMLASQPVFGFSKAQAKRCVDQCWNSWVRENGCQYGRPSKQMREAFGIGNAYVAWISEK